VETIQNVIKGLHPHRECTSENLKSSRVTENRKSRKITFNKQSSKKNLIAIVILSLSLTISCSDSNQGETNSEVQRVVDTDDLARDTNFIELVVEMEGFKTFSNQALRAHSMAPMVANQRMNNMVANGLTIQQQYREIERMFPNTPNLRLKTQAHMVSVKQKTARLRARYPHLTEEQMAEAYAKVYVGQIVDGPCNWRYYLCIGAAGATAALCHTSCSAAAAATTAGLGIPGCIWACATVQVYMSVLCYDAHCNG
jgi:hypothetical protein